ncbi:MAG TPA: radical SAM protein [Bryobacteraceae bacterium]|jgi:DNA repair photolyase|nr:radical SAM protein [Bryobacteraceae bacterium]
MPFEVFQAESKSVLSTTTGFIAQAGFTHSLTPARNCTFGCSYCYVPTMGIFGGLKPDDWKHWGQFTTFKSNAPELLRRQLRAGQVIYCSPLVDPYQPAEASVELMPRILDELLAHPPRVFVIQTRGPLILRDLDKLVALALRTALRVSFSVTTNREDVRRLYEPHCASIHQRIETIRCLRGAGIDTFATLAPLLPCDPEELAGLALEATERDIVGDALHVRSVKPNGATTRAAAFAISEQHEFSAWLDADFQAEITARIGRAVNQAGRRFGTGPESFRWLTQ